jgi:uncharacterized membrane-anchored protein
MSLLQRMQYTRNLHDAKIVTQYKNKSSRSECWALWAKVFAPLLNKFIAWIQTLEVSKPTIAYDFVGT